MKRCPITYGPADCGHYSRDGLRRLSPKLERLEDLPFTQSRQLELSLDFADKLSFSGVQPKLSARLNVKAHRFEVVRSGDYLLKPPLGRFPELPQNEDLTMKLASVAGIEVPLHGMIYAADHSLVYFVKRFDRSGRTRWPLEDFSQLLKLTSDKKYETSMEQIGKALDEYASFPLLEKEKLFRLTLFSFLVGNEDLHAKNFSLLTKEGRVGFSPAYDLVNSSIVMKTDEELALTLNGKRSKFRRSDFVDYYGERQLCLPAESLQRVLRELQGALSQWKTLIEHSFLSEEKKKVYQQLVTERAKRLFVR